MTDFGGKTSIFSHPVYLFLRKFSLQDSRGGSNLLHYEACKYGHVHEFSLGSCKARGGSVSKTLLLVEP
ncbi:hypothetical protein EZJ11_26630 (plasmid) [Enterobacter hormaechei]|nr:hypothetical protein EVS72_25880 [Enterobacter hormaechei]URL72161.1 hypothetical protein EZJ11_26630 [Enterobacter hormaechei]